MAQPRVLVLLAAYNGSAWIRAQIDSIFAQAGVDITLIASDDGSSDGTFEQIAAAARPRDTVVRASRSHGTSAAQNFFGLIRATSAGDHDFVALSDQDDIWQIDKLARGCGAILEAGAAGYSCAVTAFWSDGRESTMRQNGTVTRSDFLFEGAGQGCTFLLSASFYGRLREFLLARPECTKALHYHDWSIYAVSRCWKLPWVFDPTSHVRYRQHGNNDTGARANLAGIRKRVGLIRQGWYARQLREISQLCLAASPGDRDILEWHRILTMPHGLTRKLRMAAFCVRGGRRRFADRLIVMTAVFAGWI